MIGYLPIIVFEFGVLGVGREAHVHLLVIDQLIDLDAGEEQVARLQFCLLRLHHSYLHIHLGKRGIAEVHALCLTAKFEAKALGGLLARPKSLSIHLFVPLSLLLFLYNPRANTISKHLSKSLLFNQ